MNKNKFQKGFIPLEIRETHSNNKRDKSLTGFTLIELLVVIAIIGILASIILMGFTNARNRTRNAAIMNEMNQLRTTVEIFNGNTGTYVGACGSGTDCARLQTSIANRGTGMGSFVNFFSANRYCVQYPLVGGGSWCVDFTGYSGRDDVSCDSTNLNCVSP